MSAMPIRLRLADHILGAEETISTPGGSPQKRETQPAIQRRSARNGAVCLQTGRPSVTLCWGLTPRQPGEGTDPRRGPLRRPRQRRPRHGVPADDATPSRPPAPASLPFRARAGATRR
eukprot:CAMPEP_0175646008 /NCGR_PEP_ID=MMETSP0097-20121207/7105_1 /TAXON_ID=311494 /ORGANISM="Alexandrium monilatum, Strain CCMP3105" /LENGTH=117 /DNA_ID=CAMNT_0016951903 /DNA_START=220 /DNA_END=569 /DNA_ORIENTATION=-